MGLAALEGSCLPQSCEVRTVDARERRPADRLIFFKSIGGGGVFGETNDHESESKLKTLLAGLGRGPISAYKCLKLLDKIEQRGTSETAARRVPFLHRK
jgi:hypothetical protein